MSEVNDVARVVEVEWEGRRWKLTRPNYGTEGAYARFLRLQAIRDLDALAADISKNAYDAGMKAITNNFAARGFDWGTPAYAESLSSPTCIRELLWLVLTQTPDQRSLDRSQMERFYKAKQRELIDAYDELMAPTPPTPPQGSGANG